MHFIERELALALALAYVTCDMSLDHLERDVVRTFKTRNEQRANQLIQSPYLGPIVSKITTTIKHGQTSNVSMLHLAAIYGWMTVVNMLVTRCKCEPTQKDSDGRTPLHYAAFGGQLEITNYFMNERHCDPMIADNKQWTPLHYACDRGHVSVARSILSSNGGSLANTEDLDGNIPVYYATYCPRHSYNLLKMFKPFQKCIRDFPAKTRTKVVLTGDSGTGKTTISQLLFHLTEAVPEQYIVEIEQQIAAGIVPLYVNSKFKGISDLMVFDFFSQQDYYSTEFKKIVKNSAAIFICLVNISLSNEQISESVNYWMNLVENACKNAKRSSHMIIVGSHADQVTVPQELKKKSSLIDRIAGRRAIDELIYEGFVDMDCRRKVTTTTHRFLSLLSTSQRSVKASQPSISFSCHLLYTFLHTKLQTSVYTLQELHSALIQENHSGLTQEKLPELLMLLSNENLILFMQNEENLQSSLVLTKSEALLREVNTALFSTNHPKVSSNTGIVFPTTLCKMFPKYNVKMIVQFLQHMGTCQPVTSLEILHLNANLASSLNECLFFPGLVMKHRPGDFPYPGFGWCLGYSNKHFTTEFLHVLLLRLAFKFPQRSEHISPNYGLERRCQIWRNGISWKNVFGVSTVVEIVDRNRWIIVLLSQWNKKAARTCSSVIRFILDLIQEMQQKLQETVSAHECLISPVLLERYPFDTLPDTDLFSIGDVARSMLFHHEIVLDWKDGKNELHTEYVLSFEPYYCFQPSIVCQLFDSEMDDQHVPSDLLQEVREYRSCEIKPKTYKELRECLDKHSIFAGRNPLVSIVMYMLLY